MTRPGISVRQRPLIASFINCSVVFFFCSFMTQLNRAWERFWSRHKLAMEMRMKSKKKDENVRITAADIEARRIRFFVPPIIFFSTRMCLISDLWSQRFVQFVARFFLRMLHHSWGRRRRRRGDDLILAKEWRHMAFSARVTSRGSCTWSEWLIYHLSWACFAYLRKVFFSGDKRWIGWPLPGEGSAGTSLMDDFLWPPRHGKCVSKSCQSLTKLGVFVRMSW